MISSSVRYFLWCFFFLGWNCSLWAFNPPVDATGVFTVRIGIPKQIRVGSQPVDVSVEIENRNPTVEIEARVRMWGTDGWELLPASEHRVIEEGSRTIVKVAPKSRSVVPFVLHPAPDSYAALYPVHAGVEILAGTRKTFLHPIAIVEAERADSALVKETSRSGVREPIPLSGTLPLLLQDVPPVEFEILPDGETPNTLKGTWSGTDPQTGTFLSLDSTVSRGGENKRTIVIHPPWRTNPGSARITWNLKLPDKTPITFGAFPAVRDTGQAEPPTDGVTFRVRINGEIVAEKHTASTTWEEIRADLSAHRGETVRLTLESDVGPDRDSTCDLSYWGTPWVAAGTVPEPGGSQKREIEISWRVEEAKALVSWCLRSATSLEKAPVTIEGATFRVFLFPSEAGTCGIGLVTGPQGILDAGWAVGTPGGAVGFHGFRVELEHGLVTNFLSGYRILSSRTDKNRFAVQIDRDGEADLLSFELDPTSVGLKVTCFTKAPVFDFSNTSFDATAVRIYAGVGNVIEKPSSSFRLDGDGHRLSTRHVGLEFENGLALVLAVTNPPDRFVVDPHHRLYSLHTRAAGSFHLIPSAESAFDAALRYRTLTGMKAAPGVSELAGRFTFDLWGGTYGEVADRIERAAKYGLNHSIVVFHNWQRWGYDYRLPDIFPPNPHLGSLADFQHLRNTCKRHGILFAPHDNYIDFYPDAEGFSYDHVCFDRSGRPVEGWFNIWRGARSYRFRPDRFLPFLERNLALIRRNVGPDAYFVDVFSSIKAFPYWGRDGGYHSPVESVENWQRAFDRIRQILGGKAPQISESGTDWLIGHLDGAQCNHIGVSEKDQPFSWGIVCSDHERVPWQDLVTREFFVLQGVGYPARYSSAGNPMAHGIQSDDYLSDEILTGHSPMVSVPFSRAVVRKYWLLHDFLNEIAAVPVQGIEFEEKNIHRFHVTYANGAEVWVNRGADDWVLRDGTLLPQYGFLAEGPETTTGVVRKGTRTVEFSRTGQRRFFADARGIDCRRPVAVSVALEKILPVSGESRTYEMVLRWNRFTPIQPGIRPFVHFTVPGLYQYDRIVFQPDGPLADLHEVAGATQTVRFVIPSGIEEEAFTIKVGLYDLKEKRRRYFLGPLDALGTVRLGTIQESEDPNDLTVNRFDTSVPPPDNDDPTELVDFGWCRTSVGVQVFTEDGDWIVRPLPDGIGAPFELHLPSLGVDSVPRLVSEKEDGNRAEVETETRGDYLGWRLDPTVFQYRLSSLE